MPFTRLFEDSVQGRCFVVGLAEGVSHFVCAVSVPVDYIQCIGDEGTRIVLLHEGEILLLFLSEGCVDMWGDQVTLCAGRTIHLNLLERTVEAVEVGDVVVPIQSGWCQYRSFDGEVVPVVCTVRTGISYV